MLVLGDIYRTHFWDAVEVEEMDAWDEAAKIRDVLWNLPVI